MSCSCHVFSPLKGSGEAFAAELCSLSPWRKCERGAGEHKVPVHVPFLSCDSMSPPPHHPAGAEWPAYPPLPGEPDCSKSSVFL